MTVKAAVDIGTNSIRLLIVSDAGTELVRRQVVTGLGKGVDREGALSPEGIARTLEVLADYGRLLGEHGSVRIRAVATSACRDASNRDEFLDSAEAVLGVRPEVISGEEEARLAFLGATIDPPGKGPFLVVDIGGGSTELVWETGAVSVDIGSVRLTDRMLPDRPAPFDELEAASRHVEGLLERVELPDSEWTVIGVAGTWTSLAAIHLRLDAYDPRKVHHSVLDRLGMDRLVERLASLSVEQTAAIPALDPARAPVILAGAVVARECMRRLGVLQVVVSERDLLDGVVAGL